MKYETEIREVLELQKQISEMQAKVSKILYGITDKITERKFVVDGKIWELDRWPREGAPTKAYFHAWRLKFAGTVAQ
jgi:hypothetical protein